jgi:hypothetical protein
MTNELQDLALNSAHIHVCAKSRGECARGRKKNHICRRLANNA